MSATLTEQVELPDVPSETDDIAAAVARIEARLVRIEETVTGVIRGLMEAAEGNPMLRMLTRSMGADS